MSAAVSLRASERACVGACVGGCVRARAHGRATSAPAWAWLPVSVSSLAQTHVSDAVVAGDGGAQRTLSAERGVQRTPSVEAASARPPFAKFNSRRMDEKWCVMNPELQELASIDVVRCDGYQMPVADISVNTADNTVAVASMSGEAHIFSIKDGKVRGSVSEPVRLPLTSIAHNYDGTLLATGAADKILRVFSLKAGNKEIASSQAHQAFVTCVAFARRNRTLLASGGGDKPIVRIWEVKEAQDASGQGELFERCVLVGHWAFVSGLAFSHDDSCVVSCCLNGTIRMWDVAHGEPMVNMSFASSVVQDRSCMQVRACFHVPPETPANLGLSIFNP
jgi:hypothetical protein